MDNKKIPTHLGTIILAIIALTAGLFVVKHEKTQKMEDGQVKIVVANKKVAENNQEQKEENKESSINWNNIRIGSCEGREKYEKLNWWGVFGKEVEKISYYSDDYIEFNIESINNNNYLNPEKITYTYKTYCDNEKYNNHSICVDKDKKLSIIDFDQYSQGCLSEDGKVFLALFSGAYLGEGNHMVRYDIVGNVLQEAQNINGDESVLSSPPTSFGKKRGSVIEMKGKSGDAGCGLDVDFEYDISKNQIKAIKKCSQCMEEKPICTTF